jgi:hypothetical protein
MHPTKKPTEKSRDNDNVPARLGEFVDGLIFVRIWHDWPFEFVERANYAEDLLLPQQIGLAR